MATKPTQADIRALAEKRTTDLGFPREPRPGIAVNLDAYLEERDTLLANQIRNAELELTRRYELACDREQQAQQREQDERAALESRLKADYRAAAPGTTDADADAALPDLLHRHRLAQLDQHEAAVQTARRRISI